LSKLDICIQIFLIMQGVQGKRERCELLQNIMLIYATIVTLVLYTVSYRAITNTCVNVQK